MKREYQRHLPHQIPEGFPLFLTWNLKGAFPKEVIERLRAERDRLARQPRRPEEAPRDRRIRESKIMFLIADRYLDSAQGGPLDLKDPVAAGIVEASILFGAAERYALFAWCVMPNHVHALLTPRWELRRITQGIKGYTSHEINALAGQRGRAFWQDESFDHWVRDEDELLRIINYIENNPVAAGLCRRAEDWCWSSARRRAAWPSGKPYVRQAFQPDKRRGTGLPTAALARAPSKSLRDPGCRLPRAAIFLPPPNLPTNRGRVTIAGTLVLIVKPDATQTLT